MIRRKVRITGTMTVNTGLSIGGQKDGIGIAEKDNPIIRNPLTNKPYIPGSSIKGKMRSLFERSGVGNSQNGLPCKCGKSDCPVCKLFGAHMNPNAACGTPRLIFRDANLTPAFESVEDSMLIENKAETAIDRISGTAKNGSLRQRERVAAGTEFLYEIIILVHDGDNENDMIQTVESGLRMIESTGLGGKVTAGYGHVDFHIGENTYHVESTKFMEA